MTETTTTTEIVENSTARFEIPAQNREALEGKLRKLAKRAAKLGAPISWIWGAELVKPGRKLDRDEIGLIPSIVLPVTFADGVVFDVHYEPALFVEITVSTVRPRFAGWEFLGVLNHTDIPGQVLRRMVPGIECPVEAREAAPGQCDHCRKTRARLETFIVRHADEGVRVIGRSCLRDFLGHASAAMLAESATFASLVVDACEDACAEGYGGGSFWYAADVLDALSLAFTLCRTAGGYRPASFDRSTRDALSCVLWPGAHPDAIRAARAVRQERTLGDCERAWAALTWLADAPADSDFMHNIRAVAGAESINHKTLGMLCGIIPGFDRAMVKRSEKRAPSTHVGTVGARVDFGRGTVERVFPYDTMYGTGYVVIIRLESGAILKWKSSSFRGETGDVVDVRATVKAHGEYKGIAQTEITRAKLEKVEAA